MQRKHWTGLLLVLATCATFGRVLAADFLRFDDPVNVYENPYVAPGELLRAGPFWTGAYEGLYVPLTYSTWTAVASFARRPEPRRIAHGPPTRLDAWPFHAANLALHACSALLAFALLRRLVADDLAAGAGALLFALHPVQVEPVAWITGLKDVLCGLLSIAALLAYVRYARSDPRGRPLAYGLATFLFVLALLAKPSAAALPLLAFAIERWMLARPLRESALALAPWCALSLLWVWLARSVQQAADPTIHTALWQRPLVAGDALAFYLGKLAWPASLAPDYARPPGVVLTSDWSKFAWIVPLALLATAILLRKRWPWLLAASAIFVGALLPVAGFVPFDFQRFATVADRYLYLALLGPALALAAFLAAARSRVLLAACALALAALAVRSSLQTRAWKDTVALFEHTLEAVPGSATAHIHLADVWADDGQTQKALASFRKARELRPNYPEVHNSLGAMMAAEGRTAEAMAHFRDALRTTSYAPAQVNLAKLLIEQGQSATAVAHLNAALDVRPHDAETHYVLGNALVQEQELAAAAREFAEAVRLQPDFATAHANLGFAQWGLGFPEEAAASFEAALRCQPDLPEAHANLGRLLAGSSQPALALPHLREALKHFPDDEDLKAALASAQQAAPAQQ